MYEAGASEAVRFQAGAWDRVLWDSEIVRSIRGSYLGTHCQQALPVYEAGASEAVRFQAGAWDRVLTRQCPHRLDWCYNADC